jgi:hypothetical protein
MPPVIRCFGEDDASSQSLKSPATLGYFGRQLLERTVSRLKSDSGAFVLGAIIRHLRSEQVISEIGITEFELQKNEAAITLKTTPRYSEA